MSDVNGAGRIAPPPLQTPGPAGAIAQVVNPPPRALNLILGDSLTGTVAGESRGHLLVRTELGLLTLATNQRPPVGTAVTLQVRQAGAELLLLLFQTPARGQQTAGPEGQAGNRAGGQTAGQSANQASGQAGQTPARPAPPHPPPLAREDSLTLGRPLRAQVETPAAARPGTTPLQAGARLTLRPLEIQPPAQPLGHPPAEPTAPPAPAAAKTATTEAASRPDGPLVGTVIGRGSGGQTLLQSPLGLLLVDLDAELPAGTRLRFELLEMTSPKAGEASSERGLLAGDRPAALARGWPALEEALPLLAGGAGRPVISDRLPQPGVKLASNLLFLLSALRAGDLEGWLGATAVAGLHRQGHAKLVERLAGDFTQLSRLGTQAADESWRLLPLPLLVDGRLQPVRLFLRGKGGGKRRPGEARTTRFILDLDLSRLGPLQLDGLVQAARFDLMLRSRSPLAEALRTEIRGLFEEASAAAGYGGQIVFQASDGWQPMALPDAGPERGSLLV